MVRERRFTKRDGNTRRLAAADAAPGGIHEARFAVQAEGANEQNGGGCKTVAGSIATFFMGDPSGIFAPNSLVMDVVTSSSAVFGRTHSG